MSEAARKKEAKPDSYKRDQVVLIINSVIEKLQSGQTEAIHRELYDLKGIIEQARSEISQARPSDIKNMHIPSATDELDAVVNSTAEATGVILDSCEAIKSLKGRMDVDSAARMEDEITKIFEACSFQDITGQRITKVVKTLKAIDEKITALLGIFGNKMPGLDHREEESSVMADSDKLLLNGPQLPDRAISQADIDKILAEFGG